ncbi:flagellar hook-associated protein FlgK [Shewanella acanthi]|uniref:flagellar hook-associated protein FlgK n=1 Tax=Shewanella acanthi TaxID=2864212 RepID=UPI001C654CA7|nr:flagellar hook-associated protein FlgK [Shewanella acanthi]QYJ79879.1 flagellar hook-associated protein FlgK [Shewanella acanthi]
MAIDLLNIARSGVLASQSQLGVTSNNIANANTAGYHRQVASQSPLNSERIGNSYYGTGTYVTDVKRVYNEYAARELRIGQTTLSAAETSYSKLSELDELFSQVASIIPENLNELFAGINSMADLPADLGIRNTVLSNAQQLADSLNQIQTALNSQMTNTNDEISSITDRINEIGAEIANINQEIMKFPQEDPGLLDKQDALIQELSQYAQVNVIQLDNGARSIMLGSAVMLVSGEVAMAMGTTEGNPYSNEVQLTATIGTKTVTVNGSKLGGQLGALFDYRDQTLKPAGLELDQLALGIANSFNEMQSQGFDLNGQIGSNLFTDINDPSMAFNRAAPYTTNNGSGSVSVNIDDVSALTGGSYLLSFDGTNYQLTDLTTGTAKTLTVSGTQLISDEGFTLDITAGAVAGDKFEIRPTAGAAGSIKVAMTDPKGLAAAAPVVTAASTNSGNTQVKVTQITDRTDVNFPITGSELTIQFDTTAVPPTYQAFDASGAAIGAATAYTPPSINAFGFTFEVESTAAATDSFTFDLSFAEGDNTNAVAMANLSEAKLLNNGKSTMADVFEKTKQAVGTQTKAAEVRVGSAQAVYQQAYARVESESGVNLDEEASNLLRFQQAYQASARIMTTAQEIFDSLITSVR